MPTGYTADIPKGITFKQYALNCARAFGALIMMRDDPADAPIPQKFEPSNHYDKTINETKEKLEKLNGLSSKELAKVCDEYYQMEAERYSKRMRETAELREKYEAMLEQAKAYEPPTPEHEEYAKFLVTQIEESIRFDCSTDYYTEPVKYKPAVWLRMQVKELQRTLDYYIDAKEKDIDRTNKRNEWVDALRKSLDREPISLNNDKMKMVWQKNQQYNGQTRLGT
jgi:hypothetical protein